MVASLCLSFARYNPSDVHGGIHWIGVQNYARMFSSDPIFWNALWVTFLYSIISIPLQLAGGLLVALILNQNIRGIALYRTGFYLPVVIGGVATSLIWMWLFSPSQGLINVGLSRIYEWLGRESPLTQGFATVLQFFFGAVEEGSLLPGWTASERGALNSLILMSLWGLGGSMIVNLAGLQSIPNIYYEAAHIDGAGAFSRFWHITLPLLSPTVFFNLIMGIIGSFQVFTQGFVMTGGGPNNATRFYVLYTYQNAFEFFRMGYASALAWVLFVIILIFTLLVMRTSRAWVFYEAQKP
ncbi:MAG: sugar ABC transporter permease [Candidatus Hydrogenedentes bacterium]|nr:sugar ABC transporter permease [Candidatus Hydrogenedentota bacterium]